MNYVSLRFGCFSGNECVHEEKNRLKVCNPYDRFAFLDILTDSFSVAKKIESDSSKFNHFKFKIQFVNEPANVEHLIEAFPYPASASERL